MSGFSDHQVGEMILTLQPDDTFTLITTNSMKGKIGSKVVGTFDSLNDGKDKYIFNVVLKGDVIFTKPTLPDMPQYKCKIEATVENNEFKICKYFTPEADKE